MARESISGEVSALKSELKELNLLLNKMVATNINVQSKVTESLIKMDDLLKEVKDMVELLQVATEMESGPSEIRGLTDMNESMRTLNKNVESVEVHLRKIYRRLFMMSQASRMPVQSIPPAPYRPKTTPDNIFGQQPVQKKSFEKL